MGQSTDGIVFYGFPLGLVEDWDDTGLSWLLDEDTDWEDRIAALRGIPSPPEPYEGNKEAHSAYWSAKSKLIDNETVGIGTYCSGEYPGYYVYAVNSERTANRGECLELNPSVNPDWDEQIKEFCALLDIKWQAPTWYVTSYWG